MSKTSVKVRVLPSRSTGGCRNGRRSVNSAARIVSDYSPQVEHCHAGPISVQDKPLGKCWFKSNLGRHLWPSSSTAEQPRLVLLPVLNAVGWTKS